MRCFLSLSLSLLLVLPSSLGSAAGGPKDQLEGVVNLNTASPDELRLIPGVGPARVRNILAYRRLHPFRSIEELARIKGIGRKTVRRWRQHLAVSGPSTAQRVTRPEQPSVPFVGPPALPVARSQAAAKPLQPALQGRAPHPGIRRGEPTHAWSHRSPADACLPPP
jgi:competence ComEA-like helix-hairpin-helix protein